MRSLPTLKVVAHFATGTFLAASPDGRRICLYFTGNPIQSYTLRSGRWAKKQADDSGDSLQVIDLATDKSVFQRKFREQVFPASFFADGERLYAETLFFKENGRLVHEQVVIDLHDGSMNSETRAQQTGTDYQYHALRDDLVLVDGLDLTGKRSASLMEVTWRDNSVKISVPYATRDREEPGHQFDKFFSADRSLVAYGVDHSIVCRRTSDLGVLWTSQVDRAYFGAPRIGVSADGKYVVAAVTDSLFSNLESRYYLAMYDGKTGQELQRLKASGTDGVAVSPDGALIAAAHVVATREGSVPTVFLIKAATGDQIAAVRHDLVRANPFMNAGFEIHGVEFTSDGRYLITATHDTRIWDLSGL
jgi:WD40 repeat protein